MTHRLFWNDESGFPFIIGRKFTIRRDGIVDVSLSFDIAGNDSVCMTAYQKFTFITGGVMKTVATGDTVTLPMGKDVFIVSTCDPHHMHKFCVSNDPLREASLPIWNLRWSAKPKPPLPPLPPQVESCKPKRRKVCEFHMY
jgi:hypothetical protein